MKQTEVRNFKKFDSENFLQGGGGGGGPPPPPRSHGARLNVKTSRSVFINASRR